MKLSRFLFTLLCMTAGILVGFSSPEKTIKATWIWQAEMSATQQQEILQFARENGINTIYLHIDRQKPFSHYRSFLRAASKAGINVHALGGHPAWALTAHRERMMELVDWVHRYNREAQPDERIAGIHLDIEPYLLPAWDSNQTQVLQQWVANMQVFVEQVKEEADLEVSADLAFWLDDTPVPNDPERSVSEWMIETFDHVTLMAYRNSLDGSNGIEALVKNELGIADRLGKSVVIAVNAKEMPGEAHTTFHGAGEEVMNRVLEQTAERLRIHPSFAGIAVHDYRYWQNLRQTESPQTPPPPDKEPLLGTYIWHADVAVQEADEILSFAKLEGINLLYVRLDLEQPYEVYRELVGKATAAGIEVHAMGGHPLWAQEAYRERMLKLVRYVKNYNKHASPSEQFRGIHLDIEPYVLPAWREDPDRVLRQWMGNIEAFVRETKEDSQLQTSSDLAVWLDRFDVPDDPGTSFSKWMIAQHDHITLMAFRDQAAGPGGIAAIVEDELRFADELGKKAIIAVEMKESSEGDYVSFHEEGKAEMRRQLSLLPELLADHPSYRGNAVHAYEYWKRAKE
ncbi:hypothetical protein NDK47_20425 [Brevibacillus ruminantium]|uniref:Glycosyl hydrolase-like 10 domain-containing protein n=1 Tax=Brevibacillus ruminantium TaxID=2950604 RepID=A0ABY4WBR9_9BACL|nr:hypothetical protein [Brevibacillus ruminantium]USG64492.1 hypothetical protein NDK47_20425 [Brevibacillus ruminantium]